MIAKPETFRSCYSTVLGLEVNLQLTLRRRLWPRLYRFNEAAAFIFATCGGNVLANNANADDTPEKDRFGRTYKGMHL